MCARCGKIHAVGAGWRASMQEERDEAAKAYAEIRKAHRDGYTETMIAGLMGVDRMTVRRALGKR